MRSRGSRQVGRTGEADRGEVTRLALAYSLLSRETSFVAVEHREDAMPTELLVRRVPVALSDGMDEMAMPLSGPHKGSTMTDRMIEGLAFDSAKPAMVRPAMAARRPGSRLSRDLIQLFKRPTSANTRRPLDVLVSLQQADGRWDDLSAVAHAVGWDSAIGEKAALALGNRSIDAQALATVLALAWLDAHAASERIEWTHLARKAEAWLAGRLSPSELAAYQGAVSAALA